MADRETFGNYVEHLSKKAPGTPEKIKKALILAGAAAFLILTLILILPRQNLFFLFIPVAAGVFFLVKFLWRYTDTEYEYLIAEGEFSMDVIYGQESRKTLFCIPLKNLELVARAGTEKAAEENPAIRKRYVCAEPAAPDTYFALFRREGESEKELCYFEATPGALSLIRRSNPHSVIL